MKLIHLTRILMLFLSLGLLAAVLSFPPVKEEQWSSDWGGGTHTRHGRTGMEPASESWEKDTVVLTAELMMIAALFSVAAVPPKKGSDAAALLAKAALVLHLGTILLPMGVAGSDTIWVARFPILALMCIFQLVPQAVLGIACLQLAWIDGLLPAPAGTRPKRLAYRNWVFLFAFAAAVTWTAWSFTRVPIFGFSPFGVGVVMSRPLSGVWAVAVAMWLTLGATTLAVRRFIVPVIPAEL